MFHFSMQNIDVSLMKYKETYIHKWTSNFYKNYEKNERNFSGRNLKQNKMKWNEIQKPKT